MFRSLQDLTHDTVGATDGHIGAVKDIYFDDQAWSVRYLVSVKEAPVFDSTEALNRAGETRLYPHDGRAGYWLAVQP